MTIKQKLPLRLPNNEVQVFPWTKICKAISFLLFNFQLYFNEMKNILHFSINKILFLFRSFFLLSIFRFISMPHDKCWNENVSTKGARKVQRWNDYFLKLRSLSRRTSFWIGFDMSEYSPVKEERFVKWRGIF